MKCPIHPDADAVGICVNCRRTVCSICCTIVGGKICCPTCVTDVFKIVQTKRTFKPVVGGVLGIITGIVGMLIGLELIAFGFSLDHYGDTINWIEIGFGIGWLVLGWLAASGTALAIARRYFMLAIIGGVCALLAIAPLGLLALILIAASRDEFKTRGWYVAVP